MAVQNDNFFPHKLFQKILSGTVSKCQTVWIQIRTDLLLVPIWLKTVCKGYQQMSKSPTQRVTFHLRLEFKPKDTSRSAKHPTDVKINNYVKIASLKSTPTCKLINSMPGLRLLISSFTKQGFENAC